MNFAEIGGFINFMEIGEYTICLIDLGGGRLCTRTPSIDRTEHPGPPYRRTEIYRLNFS